MLSLLSLGCILAAVVNAFTGNPVLSIIGGFFSGLSGAIAALAAIEMAD